MNVTKIIYIKLLSFIKHQNNILPYTLILLFYEPNTKKCKRKKPNNKKSRHTTHSHPLKFIEPLQQLSPPYHLGREKAPRNITIASAIFARLHTKHYTLGSPIFTAKSITAKQAGGRINICRRARGRGREKSMSRCVFAWLGVEKGEPFVKCAGERFFDPRFELVFGGLGVSCNFSASPTRKSVEYSFCCSYFFLEGSCVSPRK